VTSADDGRSVRGVALLGSTGSVGQSALRVLARQRGRFRVAALTAHHNAALLAEQAAETAPDLVGLVEPEPGAALPTGWRTGPAASSRRPRTPTRASC
jgi:1-deoxy-D-xylulose-5-phosphate reductoisomerase